MAVTTTGPGGGHTPLDRATLAYVAVPTLALALSFRDGPIAGWPFVLAAQVLTVVCVLLAPAARRAGPVGRVVGDLYPLLLLPALYGEIDPSYIITHRVTLDEAPMMYRTFREKRDGCVKVVMRPE